MAKGRPKKADGEPAKGKKTKANGNGANLGFEAQMFLAADKLRKNLEPSDYKHVALGLIFLRYISIAFEARRAALLAEDAAAAEDPDEYLAENVFWVPKVARWSHLQANARQPTIGKLIDEAMAAIEKANEGLKGVLAKDYNRPALDKVMLGELIDLISGIALDEPGDKAKDVLGRVYEYFLGGFAGSEGKRGGEFYTPQSVVRVLVEMLEPYKGRVYDPCCGSGGMFVQSEKFVENHGGKMGDIAIYGQESNYTTWRLAKMNLAVRGIEADIRWNNEGSFHKDELIAELTEDEVETEQERLKRKWASVEALVGSTKRLALVAEDLVTHFEARMVALDGKAMIVCMSRRICVALHDAIKELRPQWYSADDEAGAMKVVMSGAASDPPSWQEHIGKRPKARRELLAKRAKDAKDTLKLVIVRDMWLTGFDAPSMHTMYVDKPMKGHGLMQAIARVNRVFSNKPAGLVVDYIGVAQNLKSALGQYSPGDRDQTGIDEAEAVRVLLEKYEVVKAMFRPDTKGGFDYRKALDPKASATARLAVMAGAIDWVLALQQEAAVKEKTEEEKKRAHRRFADAVVALSKAFALASASDEARAIRDEVGFFQAIRAALIKSVPGDGKKSAADRELAIQQLVSRAVVSTEIVDIMKAAGFESPDISILSDAFLAEVRDSDKKNLAIEALKKLINGDVRAQSQRNVTQSRAFSERLEAAIARYHLNALTTAQVLDELIQLARDIRAARSRGAETGLTDEEIAFYDALAENASAREAMGEPALRVIATELVKNVKGSVSTDWTHRASARARIRVLVKRILRKYGYPPDLEDAAVQNILQQAEVLSAEWAS